MSFFDMNIKGNDFIRKHSIELLFEHNDINANFYSTPPEADIQLGDILAINFGARELSEIGSSDKPFSEAMIEAITDKLNEYTSPVRKEIIYEINLLNTTTVKLIHKYQNEAYEKYNNASPIFKSKDEFFEEDYHNIELLDSLIGKEKTTFLLLRDPLVNEVLTFEKDNPFIEHKFDVQIIKDTVKTISQMYNADNYSEIAGRIMTEIAGDKEEPEELFARTLEEGTDFLDEKIDDLSDADIKTVMNLVDEIDFQDIYEENKDKYAYDYDHDL